MIFIKLFRSNPLEYILYCTSLCIFHNNYLSYSTGKCFKLLDTNLSQTDTVITHTKYTFTNTTKLLVKHSHKTQMGIWHCQTHSKTLTLNTDVYPTLSNSQKNTHPQNTYIYIYVYPALPNSQQNTHTQTQCKPDINKLTVKCTHSHSCLVYREINTH